MEDDFSFWTISKGLIFVAIVVFCLRGCYIGTDNEMNAPYTVAAPGILIDKHGTICRGEVTSITPDLIKTGVYRTMWRGWTLNYQPIYKISFRTAKEAIVDNITYPIASVEHEKFYPDGWIVLAGLYGTTISWATLEYEDHQTVAHVAEGTFAF